MDDLNKDQIEHISKQFKGNQDLTKRTDKESETRKAALNSHMRPGRYTNGDEHEYDEYGNLLPQRSFCNRLGNCFRGGFGRGGEKSRRKKRKKTKKKMKKKRKSRRKKRKSKKKRKNKKRKSRRK